MADTAVAITNMTMDTVTADIITTAEGGTSVSAGNTAVITANGDTRNLIIGLYGSGAATATVEAGDTPPALRQGLGAKALTVPSSDQLLVVLEGARYMQDNGTIRIAIATNAVVVSAHRIPDTI
jgi:hypothetical protein